MWKCPVCSTTVNSNGVAFSGLRSCSLHVASKAKTDLSHMIWVKSIEPDVDYSWSNNEIGQVIADEVLDSQPQEDTARTVTLIPIDPKHEIGRYGSDVESHLRKIVETVLVDKYGKGHWADNDWFIRGIPVSVQRKCMEKRIETRSSEPPLNFATLVEFLSIVEGKNWKLFEPHLRPVGFKDQGQFKIDFRRFNDLRNLTHGAREEVPSAEDLDFAQDFADRIREVGESLS